MIRKLLFRVFLVLLVIGAVKTTNLDDYAWYFTHDLTVSKEVKNSSIWLPQYQADITEFKIPGVVGNASGITYDSERKTLWVVVNNPTYMLELDLHFNLLRRIELKNFEDTEGIAYVDKGYYLLADERDQAISLAKIRDETKQLDKNALQQIVLNIDGHNNKGLEGIAVDHVTNTIYAVRERDPMKLIKVTGFIENKNRIKIENYDQIKIDDLYMDDLSGLHFDGSTKHLLILSHESQILAELDLKGNKVSYMDLERGFNSLSHSIPQAEGVTLDDKGNLYIVSEPNYLYRFKKIESRRDAKVSWQQP
jgi:uncharacterized protein YjiK